METEVNAEVDNAGRDPLAMSILEREAILLFLSFSFSFGREWGHREIRLSGDDDEDDENRNGDGESDDVLIPKGATLNCI